MLRLTYRVLAFLALISLAPVQAQPPSSTPWLAVEESAGIVYFVFTSPARIERYDLPGQAWLSDIPLPATPTAFTVDQQHLYVSFGRRTSRFTLGGSGEVHIKNTPTDANGLYVVGNHLVVVSHSDFWSLDKLTGAEIDFQDFFYALGGGQAALSQRKIFGRTRGIGPSDILSLSLNSDGTFGQYEDSRYHGDYPDADRVFLFPGEARVVDDAGIVYNTSDLTYSNSLGDPFDDLAFYGDLPIVLREGEVVAYSKGFVETGRHEPAHEPLDIAVHGGTVFSFYAVPGGIEAEAFPIDLLDPDQPGEPVDPDGLVYDPDEIVLGRDDILYILNRANLSVFRWSILGRRYLETIPLAEAPVSMAYSAATHRLYFSYPSGAIRQIRLSESLQEVPFASLSPVPIGLATAGELVFADEPGSWETQYVFHPDGTLLSEREAIFGSLKFTWSEARRRMYFFRDGWSPNDLLWQEIQADGQLGEGGDSPYHGEIRTIYPIRVAPDGSYVVIGSGEIFDPESLERIDSLSNDIDDADWLGGTLFTIRSLDGQSELQRWGENHGITAQRQLPGEPLRLLSRRNSLLAVTSVVGIPRFTLLDGNFNEVVPLPPLSLADGRFSVQAVWRTPDGNAGEGHAIALTRDTGYFWFFNSANVEMVLKVLDGCGVNGHFWVFAGGLTNVEVEISVTDNLTGEVKTYLNPQGTPFQPLQDTAALSGCSANAVFGSRGSLAVGAAAAPATELLLNNGRFVVEITWETANGNSDAGTPVQLTSDTGYFWFFDDDNVEVVVKVLNGCAVNGRYWVFAGGLTDVEAEIRVTDTLTGAQRTYVNPQGQPFLPLQDTGAFTNCQ